MSSLDSQTKENLALLSEATSGLKTLDSFIGEKDYKGLRLALRNPPIANLRSSARKVIIGIDNKDAEQQVCVTEGGGGACERVVLIARSSSSRSCALLA